ncbi:tRNA pseudouridine(32) synthase [Saliniradius amylolyticus]|uniref:tRNA pseudouridine(32) synthase n=1 Tax=Saliniradius amylolyticus TaxID=2183582 RepID=A0A2S2E468_9ALTE|nr:TIGR01621 family pseudouridine synthase [Saliniradius amylolyticus]AWL12445.1 tRNA pseudouridine(32) synthase [Saliniradius amylolyticus]
MLSQNDLIFQHPDFVVLNKPAGLGMHRQHGNPGLVCELAELTGESDWFLVHRLDKVTSGLLLVARHSEAAAELAQLFAERQIEKYYLALSAQKPHKKQGRIIGDMEKARRGQWKLTASRQAPAVTQFFSQSLAPGVRAFLLKPHTGKTHQLRVAMKSLSSPILGDDLYGGHKADRTYLHAYALRFRYQQHDYEFYQPARTGEHFDLLNQQLDSLGYRLPWQQHWPKIGAVTSTSKNN